MRTKFICCFVLCTSLITVFGMVEAREEEQQDDLDRLMRKMGLDTTEGPVQESSTMGHYWRRRPHHRVVEEEEDEDEEDEDEEDEDYAEEPQQTLDVTSSREKEQSDHPSWRYSKTSHKGLDLLARKTEPSWRNHHATPIPYKRKESDLIDEVVKKSVTLSRETICRVPQAKVIRIADHYPTSSNIYMPQCIRLHQCADDTGCCSVGYKCGPKTTIRVEIEVLAFKIMQTFGASKKLHRTVEHLVFYNHTACECQDLRNEMPRDRDRDPEPYQTTHCRCPSEYTVRHLANGSCSCDCFDKQRDCTKYKKGKEFFSAEDKLCISTGNCKTPACDFGLYHKGYGRCPRQHEKSRAFRRNQFLRPSFLPPE